MNDDAMNRRLDQAEGARHSTSGGRSQEDDSTASPSVTLILDQPTETDDKFQLLGGEGSYRKTLAASDAEALVTGEKVLRFKVTPDKKGYKLIHRRSDGSRRTVFLETRIQDMTEAGHGPQKAEYSYARLDIQVPRKLPDKYKTSQVDVDQDLVQESPVLVDLQVEDPEL